VITNSTKNDAADPAKLKPAVLALAQYAVWPVLRDIPYPALIIGASKDKLHEPDNLKKIVEMLPDAVYVDMETNKRTHSREMVEHIRTYFRDHCK
jgi:homoserine acetyltransferase